MNEFPGSAEFARQLLAADAGPPPAEVAKERDRLFERLAAAQAKERKSRRFTWAAGGVSLAAAGALYAFAVLTVDYSAWPEWTRMAAAMGVILFPIFALLIAGIYLLKHRRGLRQTEQELQRLAMAELPRQIAELRRELRGVRQDQGGEAESAPPEGSAGQGAFTLIEMLAVVAILSILAGLLFPALARAKARARSTECVNHLRQIGVALAVYEGEAGAYPGAGEAVLVGNGVAAATNSWGARLLPELSGNRNLLACPTAAESQSSPRFSYGYNAFGSNKPGELGANLGLGQGPGYPPVRSGGVIAPSEMIAIGDLRLPPGLWWTAINPVTEKLGGLTGIVAERHRGGANMVFIDAHVEFGRQWSWIQPSGQARRRWNNDHQPHRAGW